MEKKGFTQTSMRKRRTRSLIQLGGLIEKSQILSYLNLEIGDDLQLDPDCFEGAATFFGALLEMRESLMSDTAPQQKLLWQTRGKKKLAT